MTEFMDGPAAGARIWMRTAPKLVRVYWDAAASAWAACEHGWSDPPRHVCIYCYRCVEDWGGSLVSVQVPGVGLTQTCSRTASYAFLDPQPAGIMLVAEPLWNRFLEMARVPQPLNSRFKRRATTIALTERRDPPGKAAEDSR